MEDGKLYHNINEVADMLGVSAVTLRYWESQFKELKPSRGMKGTRLYSQEDIIILKRIYHLTKECGFTLEGARDQLHGDKIDTQKEKAIADLKDVRQFLVDLKNEL